MALVPPVVEVPHSYSPHESSFLAWVRAGLVAVAAELILIQGWWWQILLAAGVLTIVGTILSETIVACEFHWALHVCELEEGHEGAHECGSCGDTL